MPGFASEGASFCEECGARLVRACPSCGAPAGSEAKFCRGCGALLQTDVRTPAAFTPSHLAEKILASRAALESERKQVTALFADLRGSMELLEEFDTEEARRLMDPAVQMMMDAVHRYEGTVNHVLGDGIMALFGAPIATRTRRLYTMALQAIDLQEKPDEALRCELLLALGEAQNEAGERDKAEEAFYQAAGIAREMGKAELLARAALGRGGRLLLGEAHLGGDALLVPLIEAALDAVGERDGVPRARLLALLAALIHQDSPERSASLSREGVEMARRIGDAGTLAYALAGRQRAVWKPENLEERLAIATEVVRLAEEVGDKELALVAHCQRHTCLIELGDFAAAAPDFEAHSRLAEELQQHGQRRHTVQLRAMRALLAGRLEEAERLAREGLAIGEQGWSPQQAMATFGLQIFAVRKEQGRLGELEAPQKAFAEQYLEVPLWRTALPLIYQQLGREEEAREEFERLAANDFAELPRDFLWMACVTNLAETCALLHDAQRAATLYELLLPYAERTLVAIYAHTCYGSASRYLGLLAATMGRRAAAAQHFEDAIEMNMALEARPYLAHTKQDYARMLIDRAQMGAPGDAPGDRDKAFRLLTEAIAMYREIGMPKHLEMAEALLGEA